MRVAVIGGGISGLTLSFYLRQLIGPKLNQLTLVERSSYVGGWNRSHRQGRFLFELGPASVRGSGPSAPAVIKLLEDTGLVESALGSSPMSNTRFLYVDKMMQPLPTSLLGLFTSPLTRKVPWLGVKEIFTARRSDSEDESVHSFILRHFGKNVADVLVDSMVSGIFAGDISKLSVRACFGVLHEMEVKDRSVALSILLSMFRPSHGDSNILGTAVGKALLGTSSISFTEGMQVMTDKLAKLTFETGEGADVLTSTEVSRLEKRKEGGVRIHLDNNESFDADFVFSTTPIRCLEKMLSQEHAKHIETLSASVDYVSVAKVHFGYKNTELPFKGLGHLVPSKEWEGVLGMLYNNLIFPSQMNGDGSSLTLLCGGAHAPDKARIAGDNLIRFAQKKVEQHLGIDTEPDAVLTQNLIDCIPQYAVGHPRRLQNSIGSLKAEFPELTVLGNHFYGVGVADSIAKARSTAFALQKNYQ